MGSSFTFGDTKRPEVIIHREGVKGRANEMGMQETEKERELYYICTTFVHLVRKIAYCSVLHNYNST